MPENINEISDSDQITANIPTVTVGVNTSHAEILIIVSDVHSKDTNARTTHIDTVTKLHIVSMNNYLLSSTSFVNSGITRYTRKDNSGIKIITKHI